MWYNEQYWILHKSGLDSVSNSNTIWEATDGSFLPRPRHQSLLIVWCPICITSRFCEESETEWSMTMIIQGTEGSLAVNWCFPEEITSYYQTYALRRCKFEQEFLLRSFMNFKRLKDTSLGHSFYQVAALSACRRRLRVCLLTRSATYIRVAQLILGDRQHAFGNNEKTPLHPANTVTWIGNR